MLTCFCKLCFHFSRIPNSTFFFSREQLDALPKDATDLSFGNSVYNVRFDQREERPVFGHKYWFYLKDAVDDVPEYIVVWDNFVRQVFDLEHCHLSVLPGNTSLAEEYGLYVIYKEEFHQVFSEHQNHPEFGPLMVHMKVVDANGESAMDEDQWEAASG